jgi:hypothetical protein
MTTTFSQDAVPKNHPLTLTATAAIVVASVVALGYIVGMIGPSTYQTARQRLNQSFMNAAAPVSTNADFSAQEPLPHATLFEAIPLAPIK